jgi:hypothetical protein
MNPVLPILLWFLSGRKSEFLYYLYTAEWMRATWQIMVL